MENVKAKLLDASIKEVDKNGEGEGIYVFVVPKVLSKKDIVISLLILWNSSSQKIGYVFDATYEVGFKDEIENEKEMIDRAVDYLVQPITETILLYETKKD